MLHLDSLDKIVTRYFATVARESFVWGGKTYEPKTLKVSPLLLRDYTCPPMCSGCCFKFSLDYLPNESKPSGAKSRIVEFDGRRIEIWTDMQVGNDTNRCQHVIKENGRCGIYEQRPFTCDFELIRTLQSEEVHRANVLTQKLFGRGWSYSRIDGGKGALCEMTPVTEKSIAEVVRKLRRLQEWANHFGLDTWVSDLIQIIQGGRLNHQVVFYPPDGKRKGFGL